MFTRSRINTLLMVVAGLLVGVLLLTLFSAALPDPHSSIVEIKYIGPGPQSAENGTYYGSVFWATNNSTNRVTLWGTVEAKNGTGWTNDNPQPKELRVYEAHGAGKFSFYPTPACDVWRLRVRVQGKPAGVAAYWSYIKFRWFYWKNSGRIPASFPPLRLNNVQDHLEEWCSSEIRNSKP